MKKILGGAALALMLSGCGIKEGIQEKANAHVKEVAFDSGAAGKKDPAAKLPDWVPDPARAITEVIRTTGTERILRFTLRAPLPAFCTKAAASPKAATLSADWWPQATEARTDRLCADWHVLLDNDTVFAYRPESIGHVEGLKHSSSAETFLLCHTDTAKIAESLQIPKTPLSDKFLQPLDRFRT